MRKHDAVVLIVICGLALLSAGALQVGGRIRAKALMCTVNFKEIGQGLAAYYDYYDDKMPTMNVYYDNGGWRAQNCVRVHYVYSQWDDGINPKQIWTLLGCLFKAGIVTDGRTFYCPATERSMDEYLSYSNPAPWGSNINLQAPNIGSGATGNMWLRARKGYVYWPQSTELVTSLYQLDDQGWGRYKVGRPMPPMKASQLDVNKAMAVDGEGQRDDAGGFKVNALFPDGHARYQFVPRYTDPATGKRLWICPYQGSRPASADPRDWYMYGENTVWNDVTIICNYMYALEP
jgi:prepilin-type processing-associated H-X9-DG protein